MVSWSLHQMKLFKPVKQKLNFVKLKPDMMLSDCLCSSSVVLLSAEWIHRSGYFQLVGTVQLLLEDLCPD